MTEQIKYKKGFKYQLTEKYTISTSIRQVSRIDTRFISLDEEGLLIIKAGYAWDGPSGPTIDTPNSMRGSLVHDALYQLMRMNLLDQSWRGASDKEFRRICLEDGMWKIRANIFYIGVDIFAAKAASTEARKKIITAPRLSPSTVGQ